MSRLGMADLGIATLNDMRENAGMIASLDRKVPLIADADTGYGGMQIRLYHLIFPTLLTLANPLLGPLMVGRTTDQYIQAGVAALHLEDQVVNKRCGHLNNKELVDEEIYLSRIQAAVNARAKSQGDIVIIARTDALQFLGYEAAVSRLKAAITVGADVAFLEGLRTVDEGRRVCSELAPTPVLLNMVAGGVTPKLSVEEARKIGFKIIIYPAFALEPIYRTVVQVARELKNTGDIRSSDEMKIKGPKEIFEVCGLKESLEFDVAAGGTLFTKGV